MYQNFCKQLYVSNVVELTATRKEPILVLTYLDNNCLKFEIEFSVVFGKVLEFST